jgi:hypothetical protein
MCTFWPVGLFGVYYKCTYSRRDWVRVEYQNGGDGGGGVGIHFDPVIHPIRWPANPPLCRCEITPVG